MQKDGIFLPNNVPHVVLQMLTRKKVSLNFYTFPRQKPTEFVDIYDRLRFILAENKWKKSTTEMGKRFHLINTLMGETDIEELTVNLR